MGVTVAALNSPFLNIALNGLGGLTGLGFILIAGLFIALTQPKFTQKLVYVGSAILLLLGLIVIIGNLLGIPTLNSLSGVITSIPTAEVFIIAGLWIAIAKLSGLKWWVAQITMAVVILFSFVAQVVAYFFHHSTFLYSPELLLIVLVGGALLWRSWKTPNR